MSPVQTVTGDVGGGGGKATAPVWGINNIWGETVRRLAMLVLFEGAR